MSKHEFPQWHVGPEGHVYTGEMGGELVASVSHGSEALCKQVFGKPNADGVYPSLKPCRGRLIAAAPELLAACKDALDNLDEIHGHARQWACARLEAAIKKAEGC